MGDAIAEEYKSSLADLNCNSKLHINVLTILAEENMKFAANIVDTIVNHVDSIPPDMKLPCLYLIDSIIKNVGQDYLTILNQRIVSIFASVFQKVDERTRAQMYKLRLTWTAVFPNKTLYALDVKAKEVDPAWPVNAQPPPQSIHINPKFLGAQVTTAISLNPAQTLPTIIQHDGDALKVKQQIVLKHLLERQQIMEKQQLIKKQQQMEKQQLIDKQQLMEKQQLLEKQQQLRLLEEKKKSCIPKTAERPIVIAPYVAPSSTVGLTTGPSTPIAHIVPVSASGSIQTSAASKLAGESSQVASSDTQKFGSNQTASHTAQKVVIRPVQLIPHIPPKAAIAPNQRDPRQRDPRRAANTNQLASQQTAPMPSISEASIVLVSKATTVVPTVASVVKVKPVALVETKSSPKESPSKSKEEISEAPKDSAKKNENTFNTKSESTHNNKKSPVKLKSDVQVPTSSQNESHSSTHKDKPVTGSKRKKSKEQKGPDDDKQVPITSDTKTTTPVKHSNEKNSEKNKISPKDKKSSPYTSRNQIEEKRYTHRRSRSPVHKTEKKSPKTRGGNRDLRQRKQFADRAKKKLSTKLRNESNDADVDLRRLLSSEDDKHQKGSKHSSEDEKKEDSSYEPPEKKTKEDKENATLKDSLFGNEDQDYRQLPKSGKKCAFEGWATYKKAHPDEFKSPLRQSRESIDSNQSPYEEYGNNSGKKPPRESGSPNEMEFDRLGRPRLLKMRQFSRSDFFQGCLRRDGDFPYNHQNNSDRLHHILSDHEDILRKAEEKYRLGIMSKTDFDDIQRELENVSRNKEFRMKEHGLNRPLHYGHEEETRYHRHQAFVNNLESMYNNDRAPSNQGMNVQGPSRPLPADCTIRLDGKLRKIHLVDDKALVFMDNKEPRQLTFNGEPTEVCIEGVKPILLRFDGKPVEFELSGTVHSMKFGTPSRELYIDNCPYEGKFGGPPFSVRLENGHVYNISLGGPQPILQVSEQPAYELCEKYNDQNRNDIDMRLQPNITKNDTDWRPLSQKSPLGRDSNAQDYQRLGAGPSFIKQEPDDFSFEEEKFSNERDNIYFSSQQKPQEWKQDYPLLPLPEVLDPMGSRQQDWRHPPFQGVKMANSPHNTPPHDGGSYPSEWDQSRPPRQFNSEQRLEQTNRPWMPRDLGPGGPRFNRPPFNALRDNNMQRFEEQQRYPENFPGSQGNFRHRLVRPEFKEERGAILPPPQLMAPWRHPRNSILSENTRRPVLLPPPQPPIHMRIPGPIKQEVPDNAELPITLPPVSETSLNSPLAQIIPSSQLPPSSIPDNLATAEASSSLTVPLLSLPIDITSLFAKLVATGIISQPTSDEPQVSVKTEKESEDEKKESEKKEENEPVEHIPPIELNVKSLRPKQQGVINCLYRGSQCASCGMRFKEIHGEKYSRHLDWHFRMNRREKDGVKKAFSRKWYYEVEDWIQFEEFEDLEERARSFFELQADQQFQVEPVVEVPSVPASGQETEACVVCGEPFQLFWVEEEEEWHLRNAVRHDEQAYHPSCYDDYVKSLQEPETPVDNAPPIDVIKEDDIKKEPLDEEDTKAEPISDVDIRKKLEDERIKKEEEEEILKKEEEEKMLKKEEEEKMLKKEISELVNTMAETVILEEEERRLKEEMRIKEEMMQGKPGEEEIIGLISESDMETEDIQKEESERVVLGSGGIIMKVRAESLKPASPSVDNTTEKETAQKEPEESDEEEFRPPTPDPRFQVLPPVQRGTELSGLCCIM